MLCKRRPVKMRRWEVEMGVGVGGGGGVVEKKIKQQDYLEMRE